MRSHSRTLRTHIHATAKQEVQAFCLQGAKAAPVSKQGDGCGGRGGGIDALIGSVETIWVGCFCVVVAEGASKHVIKALPSWRLLSVTIRYPGAGARD